MSAKVVIVEWINEFADMIVADVYPRLKDLDHSGDLDRGDQVRRADHILKTGNEPDSVRDEMAEKVFTLCTDAAQRLGFDGDPYLVVSRACEKLGFPRSFNASALSNLRTRGGVDSNIGAALKSLKYGSFAQAVKDLKIDKKSPKEAEQDIILKALSRGQF